VPQVNKVLTCVTVTLQARRLALFNASGLFCVAWFSALSWVPLARLRNAFRVPCALDEAEVVQVSVREETDLQAAAAATSSASKQRRRWWQRGRRASEDAPPPPLRPTRRITLACPVMQNAVGAAYITVLGTRRVYDAARGRFVAPASEFQAPSLAQLQAHAADGGGLTNAQAAAALATLGGNEVEVPVARMLPALAEEFLQVFFVYQFACCQLWAVDHYMAYAYTLCASIIFTGVANVLLLRRTQVQLREMAAYDALVSVCRSGAWKRVNCRELVPGDVIRVEEGRVPCDAALLSGRPAVDESMLTGESLPVSKTPLPPAAPGVAYDCARHKRHTVFAGTSVLTAAGAAPVAVVTKTGLSTQKGQLLQTLMFPAPLELSYEAQARVILVALLAYSLITFGITVYFFKARHCTASPRQWLRYPALLTHHPLACCSPPHRAPACP
jgi:cation transport ATPase